MIVQQPRPRTVDFCLPAGYLANATLQQCFRNFCEFTKNHGIMQKRRQLGELQMNNFQFAHLCKDAGFAEPAGRLHREAVDVIFVRSAPTGKRLIGYKVRERSAWLLPSLKHGCSLAQPVTNHRSALLTMPGRT